MSKVVKEMIHANGIDIGIYTEDFQNEYISITDIARYKSDEPKDVIKNWMRGKDTLEFLGYGNIFIIQILKGSNSTPLEHKLVQMYLQCHRRNGLNLQMRLVL